MSEKCGNCRFAVSKDALAKVANVGPEFVLLCQRHSANTWAVVDDTEWCGDWAETDEEAEKHAESRAKHWADLMDRVREGLPRLRAVGETPWDT